MNFEYEKPSMKFFKFVIDQVVMDNPTNLGSVTTNAPGETVGDISNEGIYDD